MPRNRQQLVSWVLVGSGFLFLYRQVLVKLVSDWWTDDNYSHGFLIPLVAAYFVWERRNRLRGAIARPAVSGLIVVAGSILVLAAGVLGAELFLTRISIIGTLAGIVLFMYGWQALRVV